MENNTTNSNSQTEAILTLADLEKAFKMLEDGKAAKEQLNESIGQVIAYLAKHTDYEVFKSKMIPKGHIWIGDGVSYLEVAKSQDKTFETYKHENEKL